MKRYGHLFEQLISWNNLLIAARKAFRGKKSKRSAANFYYNLEHELITLQEELQNKTYAMLPYVSFKVYEPKERKICAASFRDRVVHHAICNLLEPILEKCLIYDTYACRKGKGIHFAIKQAQLFARKWNYFLKCDIHKYYASVDHSILKEMLFCKIKDNHFLELLNSIIDHKIPDGIEGKGLPIGNLTSQYFANLYLSKLDHYIKEELHVDGYIRYMDDFLLFANTKTMLHERKRSIRSFLENKLELQIKTKQCFLAPCNEGIPFLGFRIFPKLIRLQRIKWNRFCRKLREKEREFNNGRIDENSLIRSATSLIGHVKHANTLSARKKFICAMNYGY